MRSVRLFSILSRCDGGMEIIMEGYKKYLTKNNIKSGLVLLTAVLNFAILLFAVVSATQKNLSGDESFFANGFTLAFSECPPICDALKNWLGFYSRFHFFISLVVILVLVLIATKRKKFSFGGYGIAAVIVSLVTSLVYMINGIAADSLAGEYASPLSYTHYTLAPLGFALVALSAVALLLVHFLMNESADE